MQLPCQFHQQRGSFETPRPVCGEREYNAQPQGFIHGFWPKRVRNFDLDSEVARFVEQALPPGALQSGDQNYMEKVVALLGGD